ncbi:MAG: hypothetical protein GXP27_11990 [Planctomycetes bacterium]|nr:hypothetical protein [Planctomycetota bacterium]
MATSVWCNGSLVHRAAETSLAVAVPRRLLRRGQINTIGAIVESEYRSATTGATRRVFGRDVRSFYVGQETKPKLHYLGVGVTRLDYAEAFAEHGIHPLRFTANDAFALAEALRSQIATGRFAPGEFFLLLDSDDLEYQPGAEGEFPSPTRDAIRSALHRLASRASPEDLVVIFLSGHGFASRADEQGFFFVCRDTRPALGDALTREDIYSVLRRLPCATWLLIDACRSGQIATNRTMRDMGILTMGPEILASCKGGQSSHEVAGILVNQRGQPVGHGLFTMALLEALSGEARRAYPPAPETKRAPVPEQERPAADADGDGKLSIDEINAFVKRRVPELAERYRPEEPQVPEVLPSLTFPSHRILFAWSRARRAKTSAEAPSTDTTKRLATR